MAKEKGLSANPVTSHAKAQKKREIAKSKASTAASRNERIARRNPERLQRQVDDLIAQRDAQGGTLKPREAQTLEKLQKDVAVIRSARARTGYVHEPKQGPSRERNAQNSRHGMNQRKRLRLSRSPSSELPDDDLLRIPMPDDTPPPIPASNFVNTNSFRTRREQPNNFDEKNKPMKEQAPAGPSSQPISKFVYESTPQMRDFQKEAVKFVPSSLNARRKDDHRFDAESVLGQEEVQKLAHAANGDAEKAAQEMENEQLHVEMWQNVKETYEEHGRMKNVHTSQLNKPPDESRKAYQVEIEEIEDEDA